MLRIEAIKLTTEVVFRSKDDKNDVQVQASDITATRNRNGFYYVCLMAYMSQADLFYQLYSHHS